MAKDLVLIIRERRVGPHDADPEPVLVSDDPALLAIVGRAIAQRLGAPPIAPQKPFRRAA